MAKRKPRTKAEFPAGAETTDPAAIPEAVQDLAERIPGVTTGDHLLRPLPRPEPSTTLESKAATEVRRATRHKEIRHTIHTVNPPGPNPTGAILPDRIKIIHDGRNDDPPFEMSEDFAHRKMVIGFRADPGETVRSQLTRERQVSPKSPPLRFHYDSGQKLWHTVATPDGREHAYLVAQRGQRQVCPVRLRSEVGEGRTASSRSRCRRPAPSSCGRWILPRDLRDDDLRDDWLLVGDPVLVREVAVGHPDPGHAVQVDVIADAQQVSAARR